MAKENVLSHNYYKNEENKKQSQDPPLDKISKISVNNYLCNPANIQSNRSKNTRDKIQDTSF